MSSPLSDTSGLASMMSNSSVLDVAVLGDGQDQQVLELEPLNCSDVLALGGNFSLSEGNCSDDLGGVMMAEDGFEEGEAVNK